VAARPGRDALTGLAGPSALAGLLTDAGERSALLLLDLDGFHARNLADGFDVGDRLLRAVARRLIEVVADGQVLRLSADEFGVILPCAGPDDVLDRAHLALAALADVAPTVTACCGAVMVATEATGEVAVRRTLHHAGLALQAARRGGPGTLAGMPERGAPLSAAEQDDLDIRTALRLGDYELYFQPLVVPATTRPLGVEALIRWRRDAAEVQEPRSFLPQVRRAGLAAELGASVIEQALTLWTQGLRAAVLAACGDEVPSPLLTVNVDVEQVEQDGFDGLVLHLLSRSGIAAHELVIEIVEAVLAEPGQVARLRRLRAAGVRVAIDDFGAGPVVLSQMRELPVDLIKVDQVLVGRLDATDPDTGLIEDLQRLAGLLGLWLSVEAVETPALAQRIAGLGVPLAQGYHYARPMPPDEVSAWLRAGAAPAAPTPEAGGTAPVS
jgi:EAL domain-containing protein (putative c-di-GMP-specific phosphodiesterase class I)/GGDEF domain-containing protein